jgi:hypothetical protein
MYRDFLPMERCVDSMVTRILCAVAPICVAKWFTHVQRSQKPWQQLTMNVRFASWTERTPLRFRA